MTRQDSVLPRMTLALAESLVLSELDPDVLTAAVIYRAHYASDEKPAAFDVALLTLQRAARKRLRAKLAKVRQTTHERKGAA